MMVIPASVLLAFLVALVALPSTAAAAEGWTSPDSVWGEPAPRHSVAFDPDGHLHAATEGQHSGGGLWYVTSSSQERVVKGRWEFEPAIALRASPDHVSVRIVWVDREDRSALWLTRNDTGSWVSSRLWLGKAFRPSIAALGSGLAVVFRDGRDRLRYLRWDPVTGPTEPEVVTTRCYRGPTPLLVRAGVPWVAFAHAGAVGPRLRLAHRTDRGWRASTVHEGRTSGPALHFDGRSPVLAYDTPSGIRWARRTDGGWRRARVHGVTVDGAPGIASRGGRTYVVGADGSRVVVRRVDAPHGPIVLARPLELSTEGVYDARIAFAAGRLTVTFTTACGCAGGGGGIWLTARE